VIEQVSPSDTYPKLTWCGEEYLIVHLGDRFDMTAVADALRLQKLVRETELAAAIVDSIPGWCSLLLRLDPFDPRTAEADSIILGAIELGSSEPIEFESRVITLPVYYGGPSGCDLEFVAEANNVSVGEAIDRLQEIQFAGMVSFTPGMANCMWLDQSRALSAPKYESPRTHTPVGTVGLGGSSIALYSVASPGGFQMVGCLAVPIYSAKPILAPFVESPTLLRSGDRLVLRSVSVEELDTLTEQVRDGDYEYRIDPGRCRVESGELTWT
jgi:KipI family sensor histidine kinase inhibitor